jgi:hypothetical protein
MNMKTSLCFWLAMLAAGLVSGQPTNDNFADSTQLDGTNLTYSANFDGATMEPGEPFTGASNTVWMSWAAPADGYAQVNIASAPRPQYYGIYTGPSVEHLQPVNLVPIGYNSIYRFLVTERTVYHFQFSGGADNVTFNLQFQTFGPSSNDNFTNAQPVIGGGIYYPTGPVGNATMELGEPTHMGNVPQKSIWWKWQAPVWGNYCISPSGSLATNLVLAAYTGNAVEALTLVMKSTNAALCFPVTGGQTYYIAGAVPTNETGDILNYSGYNNADFSAHTIPGNLLLEPSWEGTALNPAHWGKSSGIGGYVNQPWGADGVTWPALAPSAKIWQNFATIPGHQYAIRFALLIGGNLSSGSGDDAQVGVIWDTNLVGIARIPANETGFWHWGNFTAIGGDGMVKIGGNTISRITFTNLARNVELDAFSLVDASAPPSIVTQPASVSSFTGGTAAFVVGANGTSPLCYQWFFNNALMDGQTNKTLLLDSLKSERNGNYQVVITNGFGSVTSAVASLVVNGAASATILSQPYGDTVPEGGYFNFGVVAAGTPPLTYQWFQDGQAINDATNSDLMLTNVQPNDAGTYTVRVQNQSSVAWSLPATLSVSESNTGGGEIDFRNWNFWSGNTNISAPVFDLDGVTALAGGSYLAQLYAGPTLDALRPAGQPTPFQERFQTGYFVPQLSTLANVAPGSNAILQVCAWDANYGNSYEQARAMGGKFGKSGIIQVRAGGGTQPPQTLQGLQSFSLQTGLPYFEVGKISFVERQPPNTIVWALQGQPGSIYLIEKCKRAEETVWHPFTVLTNITGTVTFTDTADSGDANVWYRARILD